MNLSRHILFLELKLMIQFLEPKLVIQSLKTKLAVQFVEPKFGNKGKLCYDIKSVEPKHLSETLLPPYWYNPPVHSLLISLLSVYSICTVHGIIQISYKYYTDNVTTPHTYIKVEESNIAIQKGVNLKTRVRELDKSDRMRQIGQRREQN